MKSTEKRGGATSYVDINVLKKLLNFYWGMAEKFVHTLKQKKN